ncbi:MAG TPA: DUF507 family protein [Candidatus Deferrimicrobiaceae bacterium]|nr:DUF507 family protein [Candidatus Deferrimicrobiaceae bacterium]
MRIREEHLDRICRTLLSRWKEKGLIRPKAGDDVLLGKMIGEVTADFRREQELDREVERILEKHSGELARSQASSRVMFLKIKERLARERKIVL